MKAVRSVFTLILSYAVLAVGTAAAAPLANSPINSPVNNPGTLAATVEVNVINVEVYVTDAGGKPVTDLRERDFEVREDGRKVSISHFASLVGSGAAARNVVAKAPAVPQKTIEAATPEPGEPWNLIVAVDNFDLHPASRTRALKQVREFLAHQLAPADRVMVVSLDSALRVRLPFSADRAAIDASLQQVEELAVQGPSTDRTRRQAYDNILSIQANALAQPEPKACPHEIARPAHDFASARRDEVFRTLGGLTVLVNSLSGVPGRKALLYVSDGLPLTPGDEVFQFLAEICGGGGAAGFGHQGVVGQPNTIEDDSPEEGKLQVPHPVNQNLDPMAVYDSSTLGPGAYKAASQAPLDAQSYNVGKQLDALVAHANAQRVTLYALQASGLAAPGGSDAEAGPGDRLTQFPSIATAARASHQNSLTALASGTGGRAILDVNDFGLDLARMREDLTTYYSVGYTPSHSGDGKEHRIAVKVKRSGAHLRYRETYRDKPVMEKAVDRTLAALLYGIEDNPLKIDLEIGDQSAGTGNTVTVPVRLRIPLFKVAILDGNENYEGSLRLLV